MNKIRDRIVSAVDLQEVLDEICQSLVDYFGAAFARIWLYDEKNNTLVLKSSRGMYTRTDGTRSVIKLGTFRKGKLQRIALERIPHYSNTIQDDRNSPIKDPEWAKRNGLISFAGYPLVLGDQLVGVMAFFSRQKLNENILEVMSLYAYLAALSIRDAQLIEEQKELALVDPLTGLRNRRFLNIYLERALRTSMRYDETVAVAMLDIDHFKKVNDTYGHSVGDEVLRHLAEVLQKEIRESDLAARYGGEEFTLVLHRVDEERGRTALERIRKAVESSPFPTSKGPLSITISIGYTVYSPSEVGGITVETLIEKADTALYRAKMEGRNRTCFEPLHSFHEEKDEGDIGDKRANDKKTADT